MRVLFFGTPVVSVSFLKWLHQHHTVAGVVCQPDRPVGRGYDVTSPPVKLFAEQNFLPLFQPEGPWTEKIISDLKQCNADVGVAIAYGRILPRAVFDIPKLGSVNVHFSLLPKYRGAAPMQWALINGEPQTGVTVFWLDEGMDTGAIAQQKTLSILPEDNIQSLKEKLTRDGLLVLEKFFKDLAQNMIVKNSQTGTPSMAPLLKKEDGKIDWTQPAQKIHNLIRGVVEWPGATARMIQDNKEKKLKIHKAEVTMSKKNSDLPGEIVLSEPAAGIVVQTGEGQLALKEVQPEGKNKMPAWDFWLGSRLKVGDQLL